jgi:cytochrome b involved in lipid metabolism
MASPTDKLTSDKPVYNKPSEEPQVGVYRDYLDRKMNDSTLAPTTSGRRSKVALRKGFGLADWNRLVQVSSDLAQLKGRPLQKYTLKQVKEHNTVYDGWIVLRGKVYNVSPYLAYHPGGEAIIKRVLGTDVTAVYDRYHRWVNEQK